MPLLSVRLVRTTRYPSAWSCRAVSRPRPRFAPVTRAMGLSDLSSTIRPVQRGGSACRFAPLASVRRAPPMTVPSPATPSPVAAVQEAVVEPEPAPPAGSPPSEADPDFDEPLPQQ